MFRKMPFILISIIIAILLINPLLSLKTKQIFYALSLTLKSGIVLLLPFIIFSLLFKTAVGLAHRATAIIAGILICVCCSNFLSTFLSHYVGSWIYHFNLSLIVPVEAQGLTPAFTFQFPKLIANNTAMFAGIMGGIILGMIKAELAETLATRLTALVSLILKGFMLIIPVFVAGFVVKLQYDGVIQTIIKDYSLIFILIAVAQFGYIFTLYLLLNRFNWQATLKNIKNLLPAALAGFSTMSSAAVMPLTIMGAENNAQNKNLAKSVIPATVNIHLIGDCFAIPIFAYAVMKSFGVAEPSLLTYLSFVLYFVLAKFSVAAIPGGGIIVMLPILETYLGFNAEMLSLMTALYILFDPVITSANVLGNGAFARLIDRLMASRLSQEDELETVAGLASTASAK
jgi:Na+/H+-dicarboxylate symporter